jgi:hypothetical protein
MIQIERDDGFTLIFSDGPGWDIHAPQADLTDIADLLELVDRRADPADQVDRRFGQWFAWVENMEEAEAKITEEKRLKLFHR